MIFQKGLVDSANMDDMCGGSVATLLTGGKQLQFKHPVQWILDHHDNELEPDRQTGCGAEIA